MIALIFAILFGLSLLPGRKPLCLRFAEKISDGILPEGAKEYCLKLTVVWTLLLFSITLFNFFWLLFSPFNCYINFSIQTCLTSFLIALTFLIEGIIRRKRFCVIFHTSGSTGKSKTIVKTFESLAKEVALHRKMIRNEFGANFNPTFLATIDPSHMYGNLWRVLLPKAMGCKCDEDIIVSPEALIAKMKEHEKIFLVTTPSFLDRFTAYAEQYDVPKNCVEIVTSGALLTDDTSARTAKVFGIHPRQVFGSTETGGVAIRRSGMPWKVLSSVKVRGIKTTGESVSRIAVKSPFSFMRGWYTMGDGVELSKDNRSFLLLGRTDRLAKINEERVNLAEMEDKVKALGYKDCALAVLNGDRGPFLGAVIVLPDEAREKMTRLPTALELRQQFLLIFPKGTVPKRFRIARALPRNSQSKVLTSSIVKLLESALVEPLMKNVIETSDSFLANFIFDGNAPYFQGHFPSLPILPGVAQLGIATRIAESLSGNNKPLKAVKKMKFMHIITPGVEVSFRLNKKSDDEWVYEYKKGDALCSSGVLQF